MNTEEATVSTVVERVLDAYGKCGPLAFAYGQGSTFSGFETDADLDIVMIWADEVPARTTRPAARLCDPAITSVQFDDVTYALDNLVIGRRDTQVINFSLSTFGSWCEAVDDGEGWRGAAWPLPLHAVAGFAYGVQLADDAGEAARIRDDLPGPSARLRANTRDTLADSLPEYRKALGSSARRDEGWLFHQLTVTLVKDAYAAWFAREGYYLPFPKHLDRWIARFGLNPGLARTEQAIWRTPDLSERQAAVLEFAEGVLALESVERRAAHYERRRPADSDAWLPGQGAHRVPGRQHDRLRVQRASQLGGQRALAGGDLEDVLAEPGVVHRVEAVLAAVGAPAVLHAPAAGRPV
jgi:hypothetical protein